MINFIFSFQNLHFSNYFSNICMYKLCKNMNQLKEPYFMAIQQIIRTGHWITDRVSTELKEFDITEPQYNVLRILRGRKGEPANVGQIQEAMIQRTSNVTRIVDKLVKKGLVSRQECPTNRRKMDVKITKVGIVFLEKLDKKVQDFHLPMQQNLTPEEANTLTELIKKLKGK